jgi:HEAT repeat protein
MPIRVEAASMLWNLGMDEARTAIPVLKEALADRDRDTRIQAALTLWRIDSEESKAAIPVFVEALKHRDGDVRAEAALALCISPEAKSAIPALLEVLGRDSHGLAGLFAIEALGKMGPAARVARLHLTAIIADEKTDSLRREKAQEASRKIENE